MGEATPTSNVACHPGNSGGGGGGRHAPLQRDVEETRAALSHLSVREEDNRHGSRSSDGAQAIVIGAGLSGLQAAHRLQKAGVRCLVLEARDRVGGALLSVPYADGRDVADLGPSHIDPARQPRAAALARELGLDLVDGAPGQFMELPELSPSDRRSLARLRRTLDSLSRTVDPAHPLRAAPNFGRATRLHELADAHGGGGGVAAGVRARLDAWCAALFGRPADAVGALAVLAHCATAGGFAALCAGGPLDDDAGTTRLVRVRAGAQGLCAGLARGLRRGTVRTGQVVERVEMEAGGGCAVATRGGRVFRCGAVLLAAAAGGGGDGIAFVGPGLSDAKKRLLVKKEGSRSGFVATTVLRYAEPWWRGRRRAAEGGLDGSGIYTRDVSRDAEGVYALACVQTGESGQLGCAASESRRAAVSAHLQRLFGGKCPAATEALESDWDLYSRGSACNVWDAEDMASLAEDQWRPEGGVHFIGSDTSTVWRGSMEGSLAAGLRGAEEVLEQLQAWGTEPRANL